MLKNRNGREKYPPSGPGDRMGDRARWSEGILGCGLFLSEGGWWCRLKNSPPENQHPDPQHLPTRPPAEKGPGRWDSVRDPEMGAAWVAQVAVCPYKREAGARIGGRVAVEWSSEGCAWQMEGGRQLRSAQASRSFRKEPVLPTPSLEDSSTPDVRMVRGKSCLSWWRPVNMGNTYGWIHMSHGQLKEK